MASKSNLGWCSFQVKLCWKLMKDLIVKYFTFYQASRRSSTLKINPQKSRGLWHLQKNNQWMFEKGNVWVYMSCHCKNENVALKLISLLWWQAAVKACWWQRMNEKYWNDESLYCIYLLLTDLWWEHHCCIWANTDRKQCSWSPFLQVERGHFCVKQGRKAHQTEDSGQCALVSASSDRRLCALGTRRRGLEKDSL